MKTIMTAGFAAALLLAGIALSQDEPRPPARVTPAKAAVKKLTFDDLGPMLETLGYEATPFKNKDGKEIGYNLVVQASGRTVYGSIEVSQNGRLVWLYGTLAGAIDEKCPSSVLLAMLEANGRMSPAAINYVRSLKRFEVLLTLPNANITPAVLREAVTKYADGIVLALDTYAKASAEAKAAKEPAPAP